MGEAAQDDVIETMRFDPLDGILALETHLARVAERLAGAGGTFDRHAVRNELHAATFRRAVASTVRLRAAPGGAVAIEVRDA